MDDRENYLRTLEFRNPEWIPCSVDISPASWKTYREDLEEIVLRHSAVFPDYKAGNRNSDELPPAYREKEYYRDNWGCLWYNVQEGVEGQVVSIWTKLFSYSHHEIHEIHENPQSTSNL